MYVHEISQLTADAAFQRFSSLDHEHDIHHLEDLIERGSLLNKYYTTLHEGSLLDSYIPYGFLVHSFHSPL